MSTTNTFYGCICCYKCISCINFLDNKRKNDLNIFLIYHTVCVYLSKNRSLTKSQRERKKNHKYVHQLNSNISISFSESFVWFERNCQNLLSLLKMAWKWKARKTKDNGQEISKKRKIKVFITSTNIKNSQQAAEMIGGNQNHITRRVFL